MSQAGYKMSWYKISGTKCPGTKCLGTKCPTPVCCQSFCYGNISFKTHLNTQFRRVGVVQYFSCITLWHLCFLYIQQARKVGIFLRVSTHISKQLRVVDTSLSPLHAKVDFKKYDIRLEFFKEKDFQLVNIDMLYIYEKMRLCSFLLWRIH